MAKLMIKAAGLFALTVAYATGAWAACPTGAVPGSTDPVEGQVEVCVAQSPTYARDLFGPDSGDIVLSYDFKGAEKRTMVGGVVTRCTPEGDNGPKVVIELPDEVPAGSKAEITYTLIGATFAQRVSNNDVVAKHHSGDITADTIEGGAPGDNEVIFEVTVNDGAALDYHADWDPDGEGTDCSGDRGEHAHPDGADGKAILVFNVPPLTEASAAITGAGVAVRVFVDPTSGFLRFPSRTQTLPPPVASAPRPEDAGVRRLLKASTKSALTLGVVQGDSGTINPESRAVLQVSSAIPLPLKRQQLKVGTLTISTDPTVLESDGTVFSLDNLTGRRDDGDGAGSLLVSSTGDFREGDMVFWDGNNNAKYDAGLDFDTVFEIDGGVATADFALDEVDVDSRGVIYVPNGEDPLRSGSIATVFSAEYVLSTNVTPGAKYSRSDLNYAGAEDALLAYAIAPPSNPDDSNIRVRCDKSTPCQVYFACDGADGAGYFGKMDGMIGARMVDTINAMELADVIGAEDEDFAGRLSCEVIGSGISVQVLTRSGDSLVNNTYVGGPLEGQVRDAINNAKAATTAATTAGSTAETVRCTQVMGSVPNMMVDQTPLDEMKMAENAKHIADAGC